MKKLLNVLILSTLCFAAASCAASRVPADFAGIVCGEPVFDYQQNGTVKISFCVEVPANYFEKRITFRIMPSILYANGDVEELPCHTVQGVGVVDTNYPVIDWSVDQVICYSTTVRYHEGLATATLQSKAWAYNCLSKEEVVMPLCNWEIIVPLDPVIPVYVAHAAAESDIRAALKGKIYFPVNGYTVTNAITNQPEITRMLNSLKQLIAREDFVITDIDIEGNASPEGTSRINDPLAKNRAESTRAFFEKALKNAGYTKDVPANAWTVTSTSGLGFWNEFYTAIKASNVSNKDELADRFLRLSSDPVEAEKQIRNEINTNNEVKTVMMPLLRYGAIAVGFQPITLTAEEILAIADNQPEFLTPNDIIKASQGMEPEEAIALYEKALDRYPAAVELYINTAYNYIQLNDLDNAAAILDRAEIVADEQDEKDLINLQRACVFMKKGMYQNAAQALDAVSDDGLSEYYRGLLAIYDGRNKEAVDLLDQAKDINYCIALININEPKEALKVLKTLDQDDAYVLYCSAVCYARLNEYTKANECKARAFQIDPSLKDYDAVRYNNFE